MTQNNEKMPKKNYLIVYGFALIWICGFGYLFIQGEGIQKMVWLFALIVTPIFSWGLENIMKGRHK